MTFKDLIREQIKIAYILAGEPLPDEGARDIIVETWVDDLREMQYSRDEDIVRAFKRARIDNRKFKMIRAWQVLQAWRDTPKSQYDEPQEQTASITRAELNTITEKYPEFGELFSQVDIYSDELPSAVWAEKFNCFCKARFGWGPAILKKSAPPPQEDDEDLPF